MPGDSMDITAFRANGIEGVAGPEHVERYNWIRDHTRGSKLVSFGCAHGLEIAWSVAKHVDGAWASPAAGCLGLDIEDRYAEEFHALSPEAEHRIHDVSLPLSETDETFDTAIVAEVLEHVRPRIGRLLIQEAWRVSGHVLVTVPNGSGSAYAGLTVEADEHSMIYTPEIFDAMLSPVGALLDYHRAVGCRWVFEYSLEPNAGGEFLFVEIHKALPTCGCAPNQSLNYWTPEGWRP